MSERSIPHEQHISGISAQNGGQVAAGIFIRTVQLGSSEDPQKVLEQTCRNALFLTDPSVDRQSIISAKGTRVAGTCEWITQDAKYCAWLNSNDSRLLWISGGPGKGKTMMSIFLTEELEKHIDNTQLVFFFCSAQDEKRNTAIAVLRGLLYQIITKRPQLAKHMQLYLETSKRTQQTLESLETLWILFTKLLADVELGTVFCVLDGLDECENSTLRGLLPLLVGLFADGAPPSTKNAFKLAILSRELPGLQDCPRVRLDPDNDKRVVRDIQLFVSTRVAELSRVDGFNEELRESVQKALLQRAEGTFLWVGFAIDELLRKWTCTEILKTLKELPSGLPAIYSRMLRQIPAWHRERSQAILRWVIMAARPLQLGELAAAVGVQATYLMTSVEVARDAIILCKPLLKLQEQNVSLIHQSARDYLLREDYDSDMVLEGFRISEKLSHLELAQKCLECIMQSGLQDGVIDLDATTGSQEPTLVQYAVLHWLEHARNSPARDDTLVRILEQFFCTEHAYWSRWWEAYRNKKSLSLPQDIPLLHLLCYLGFVPLVEKHIARKIWKMPFFNRINDQDSDGNTALHLAVRARNQEVAEVLINNGAEVNERDRANKTPLHLAAEEGDDAMVQLLIRRRADVNAEGNNKHTVLHSAFEKRGNNMVVRVLMDKGANVNAKSSDGSTALHLAAREGNTKIVQWLVDGRADVNAVDMFGTVLCSARASWQKGGTIMLILVNGGADLNARESDESTALHWAVLQKNQTLVQQLLDKGAFVNAKDNFGRTPLHLAASELDRELVLLLARKGADLEARTNDGYTALHETVSAVGADTICGEKLVELLIRRGADLKAKNKDGKTARQLAIEEENEALAHLLRSKEWALKRRSMATGRWQLRRRTRFPKPLAH